MINDDNVVKTAETLLSNGIYGKILANELNEDDEKN